MFRSAAISFVALLLLTGGFLLYWWMQPPAPSIMQAHATSIPTTAPTDQTQMQIGPGGRAWVDNYDAGQLSSQFTATEFTPQSDGNFKVVNPVWVFYLSEGQYMLLKGEHGVVRVDSAGQGGDKSIMSPAFMQSPNGGVLQHVTVQLFPTRESTRPNLTMETNNIAFDHDTLRLYTQSYTDASGNVIPADQVPVKVRGDDYDFDGKGLTMHWNDRDHRLQLLQIEHGRDLVIKHPNKMATPWSPPTTQAAAIDELPVMLVSADPAAVAQAIHPPAAAQATLYHAAFNDNVLVYQGDLKVAKANTMTVDFLSGKQKPVALSPAPASAPSADQPINNIPPLAAREAASQPTSAPTSAPASQASTAPATQLAEEPVTVTWTGKLRITPLDGPPVLPLNPGQAVMKMIGTPVVLTPQGSTVHAASVVYRTIDGAAQIFNSPAFPKVHVQQDRGVNFVTDAVNFNPATEWADISGISQLNMPAPGHGEQKVTATWQKAGRVHVVGKSTQPQSVDEIQLAGDVVVDHPQMHLTSDALDIHLDQQPPATPTAKGQVQLKSVNAVGNAVCLLKSPTGPDRRILGDSLTLSTTPGADGKAIPRTILAEGNVHASDPDQNLSAQYLKALLVPAPSASKSTTAPTTAPSDAYTIESMWARENVDSHLKNGSTAHADQMHLSSVAGQQQVELTGDKAWAIVKDGTGSDLSGAKIIIRPDSSYVYVPGAGIAHSVRRASTTQPARPVTINWQKDMKFNGAKNMADVTGHVTGFTDDAQGNHNQFISDSVHIDLVDVPSTQPTTAPSRQMNKQVGKIALNGNVDGTSRLLSPDGQTLWRQGELKSQILTYDAIKDHGEIPGPGTLFMEDHRPQVAPPAGADPNTNNPGGTRGSMAMQWQKSAIYDSASNRITFDGDVVVGFKQDTKDAGKMRLTADRITGFLEPAPVPVSATTRPGKPKMQLSHVTADGSVTFIAKGVSLTASTATYNPNTHLLTASGTADQPVQTFDEQGLTTGTFEQLIYNVQSQMVEHTTGAHAALRR